MEQSYHSIPHLQRNLLIVDDEPLILNSFKRMISQQRAPWKILLAEDGFQALEIIEKNRIDVVVSDMQMPGMNGCQLLKKVHSNYPQVVLVMLTGQPELERYGEAIDWCHYFLPKPVDIFMLTALLKRIFPAAMPLKRHQASALLSNIPVLTSPPQLYSQIKKELDGNRDIDTISTLIGRDPSFTSLLHKIVTSSKTSLNGTILSTAELVKLITPETVQALALLNLPSLCLSFPSWKKNYFYELVNHSYQTANIARQLPGSSAHSCDTFLAAMWHDIGKIVQLCFFPDLYGRIQKTMQKHGMKYHEAEKSLMIIEHIHLGVELLHAWKQPIHIVEALSKHHQQPIEKNDTSSSSAPDIVWYANQLSNATQIYSKG